LDILIFRWAKKFKSFCVFKAGDMLTQPKHVQKRWVKNIYLSIFRLNISSMSILNDLVDATAHSEHVILIWYNIGAKPVERFELVDMSNVVNYIHTVYI
jgi:hypothetical protein